jgi:hypothetical protein
VRYSESAGEVLADGIPVARRQGADRYRIGSDLWVFGHGGTLDHLHAGIATTRWFHAARGPRDAWRVTTPSGGFELRRRLDTAGSFDLVGVASFGNVVAAASSDTTTLVAPDQMPVPEAIFVMWIAEQIVTVTAAGVAGSVAAVNAVNSIAAARPPIIF